MRLPGAKFLSDCFAVIGYTLFSLFVVGILLELVCWAGFATYRRILASRQTAVVSPVASESWAQEFRKEDLSRVNVHYSYVPFRIWGVESWNGKYIHNDESEMGVVRRTINPTDRSCSAQDTVNVWMFGGSAVYGSGVPDWATLPSYLSRNLNAVGRECVTVVNFGVEGYVTNQEVIALAEQLKAGQRPDVVIFYDGVNDAGTAAYGSGLPVPHFLYETTKTRIEGSVVGRLDFLQQSYAFRAVAALLRKLHSKRSTASMAKEWHTKAVAALDNYEANVRFAKALSKAYGFRLYCFWQPSLYYGHKHLARFEQERVNASNPETDVWSSAVIAGYAEAASRSARSGNFVFLGGVFDSVEETLYIDMMHLTPGGNELAANTIAKYVVSSHREH